jgi:hypothetical protein
MSLRQKIQEDMKVLSPAALAQLFQYAELLKNNDKKSPKNVNSLAGILSNEDAEDMKKAIENEFNKIEGEW